MQAMYTYISKLDNVLVYWLRRCTVWQNVDFSSKYSTEIKFYSSFEIFNLFHYFFLEKLVFLCLIILNEFCLKFAACN